jgi:RNA polymerase sigma factor (sigma-70 family)
MDAMCSRRAWGLAFQLVRNAADAEDVVQQAFLVVMRRGVQTTADPWPWFAAIVANCARNHRRARSRRLARESTLEHRETLAGPPVTPLEHAELQALVHDALGQLPDDEREAVVLCYFAGLTQSQASEATGTNLNTFKGRVQRALDHLRRRLASRSHSVEAYLAALAVPPPTGGYEAALRRWREGALAAPAVGTSLATLLGAAAALSLPAMVLAGWALLPANEAGLAARPVLAAVPTLTAEAETGRDAGRPATSAPAVNPATDRPTAPAAAARAAAPIKSSAPPDRLDPPGPNPVGSLQVRTSFYETGERYMQWTELVTTSGPLRRGPFTAYHPTGLVLETGSFHDGRTTGTWERYYDNGALKSRRHYDSGRQVGDYVTFYEDGTPENIGHYEADMRTGQWRSFHRNGQLRQIKHYLADKLHGTQTNYDEQGRKRRESHWRHNVPVGTELVFDEHGNTVETIHHTATGG